jgi:transcriptional regulator with XRE-family HTH domain
MKEQLKKARTDAGLTQIQLANISGISLVTINRAERKSVKLKTYEQLFQALTKISESLEKPIQ